MKRVVLIGMLMISSLSFAEDHGALLVGAGIGFWEYEEKDFPEFKPNSFELIANYSLFPNLDLKANLGLGISEETELDSSLNELELKIQNYWGVYVKPKVNIRNHSIYAIVGYSKTRLEGTINGIKSKDTSDGISVGAGLTVGLNKSSNLVAEWRIQADPSTYELSGLSIGYVHEFE